VLKRETGGGVHGGRRVEQSLPHHPSHLELHRPLGGHADSLEGLGILGHAGGADLALEHAEVAEFEAVAPAEFLDDLIEEGLDQPFDDGTLEAMLLRETLDEFPLGDGLRVMSTPEGGKAGL
jgi:hypothetical protein